MEPPQHDDGFTQTGPPDETFWPNPPPSPRRQARPEPGTKAGQLWPNRPARALDALRQLMLGLYPFLMIGAGAGICYTDLLPTMLDTATITGASLILLVRLIPHNAYWHPRAPDDPVNHDIQQPAPGIPGPGR
ncbi:hypothetical protein [Actinoplanes sp. NPDC051494]|uniref:hypothetical protein n=1 Tax=Actinoplanes sp. NPDC051494 TaxID=3363907 RepID=UPI0037AA33EE